MPAAIKPKRLMFCGGGSRCIVYIQALAELEAAGLLTDVREYWGTSAGAYLAMILAIGASPSKIKPILLETKFHKFRDMDVRNLLSFQTTWGLDDGMSLLHELERIVGLLGRGEVYLRDVPTLHVVVTDLTLRETLVVSAKTHPNVRAIDAVRASMSLPFFYRPYKESLSGHLWIDGALRENFAWNMLPTDEEREQTLGFCFNQPATEPTTLLQYMFSMVHFDEPRKMIDWKKRWNHRILWFPIPPFPAWYSRIDSEDIEMLTESGKRVATEWLLSLDTAASRTAGIPPLSALPNNPPSENRLHFVTESSGILKSSALSPREYPSLPPLQSGLSSRRWSV